MKKIILLLFLSLFIFSCKQSNVEKKDNFETELVSQKEIYEVINFILKSSDSKEPAFNPMFTNPMSTNYVTEDILMKLHSKENNYLELNRMDTIFTKKDIEFIRKQINKVDNFKLNKNFLKGKIVIPSDTLDKFQSNEGGSTFFWENYRKKYGEKGFYTIGLPLFSLDKKTVIITSGLQCGPLCGSGATEIYKKINGKWTLISTLETWIS